MFDKILVPVDGSRWSRHAVEAAVEMARCHGSTVYLLHVIRDMSLPKEIMAMIKAGEVTESRTQILQDSAEIILENALEHFTAAGLDQVQSEYVVGDPATQILDYGHEHQVDVIVVGHRGLGPGGGLLGSVARKLLNTTDISVHVTVETPATSV